MKLTQELVVTIVFLGGSWVTLSVVAVAFPPATSSIRAAISANTKVQHIKVTSPLAASTAPVPAEDVLPTEDTTTFLQDEKPNVVQVVTTDTKKDELFILGENDAVPEKLIEENPNAKMVVIGADETTAKTKIDKFNLAAKNVAIRVALAKQAATRQAQADFAKLRDWRENGSHFALEVKAKRFGYSVQDVLKDKLEEVASIPELTLPNTEMKALPAIQNDNNNAAPNQMSMLQDKLISWRDNALSFAADFSTKQQLHNMICYLEGKPSKAQSMPAPQASAPKATANSTQAPKEGKADIQSLDLRPLNEKLTLDTKTKPFAFNTKQALHPQLIATLNAVNNHDADLPLSSAVVYQPAAEPVKAIVATQPVKAVVVEATVKTVVNTEPATVLPKAIVAMVEPNTSYSPVPANAIKTAEVKADKPLDINKVHAATTKVLQQSAKVAVTKDKSLARAAAHAAVAKAVHQKQLAADDAKHKKAVARENAIASLERQLSNEPAVIVVPAKPAQQRVASVVRSQQQAARPQYQQQAQRAQQPATRDDDSQAMRAQEMARRQPVERDPFEEYFEQQEQKNREIEGDRLTTNVASIDQARSDDEARDISGDIHKPEEYSRLMEE